VTPNEELSAAGQKGVCAFVGTNLNGELITSGLLVTQAGSVVIMIA